MKTIIYKSRFQEIIKMSASNFFEISWFESDDMQDQQYRQEILEQLRCYQEYKVQGSLIDTSDFEFVIAPDTQEWASENIFPVASKSRLRYVALIVPHDFFTKLSIEQYVAEDTANYLQFHYFDSVRDARTWLLKETTTN